MPVLLIRDGMSNAYGRPQGSVAKLRISVIGAQATPLVGGADQTDSRQTMDVSKYTPSRLISRPLIWAKTSSAAQDPSSEAG